MKYSFCLDKCFVLVFSCVFFFYCRDLLHCFHGLWLKTIDSLMFGGQTWRCILEWWLGIDLNQNKQSKSKQWATIATTQIQIFRNESWEEKPYWGFWCKIKSFSKKIFLRGNEREQRFFWQNDRYSLKTSYVSSVSMRAIEWCYPRQHRSTILFKMKLA